MKAMLASDAVEGKLRFPLLVQPKIDGVRGLHFGEGLKGRSLKKHANLYTNQFFGDPMFAHLDGELAAEHETHPDLCRLTSSALSTITGEPRVVWHLFDYMAHPEEPYRNRYEELVKVVADITHHWPALGQYLKLVPSYTVGSLAEYKNAEDWFLAAGYEGMIVRDGAQPHKSGRSTVREGGLLRVKRFVDFEFVVTGLHEGEENTNEAQIDERGLQFRSSHKEGKIPNGMIGTLEGRLLKAVKSGDEVLFEEGALITVSAGRMTAQERTHYFQNKNLILGKIAKGKLFPKGIKDKPRFATFQSFRITSDI